MDNIYVLALLYWYIRASDNNRDIDFDYWIFHEPEFFDHYKYNFMTPKNSNFKNSIWQNDLSYLMINLMLNLLEYHSRGPWGPLIKLTSWPSRGGGFEYYSMELRKYKNKLIELFISKFITSAWIYYNIRIEIAQSAFERVQFK